MNLEPLLLLLLLLLLILMLLLLLVLLLGSIGISKPIPCSNAWFIILSSEVCRKERKGAEMNEEEVEEGHLEDVEVVTVPWEKFALFIVSAG